MPHSDERTPASHAQSQAFAATRWSVVLMAGRSDLPHARDALARLCQSYWYPLYAYLRRRGHGPHDAQDLTQGFFARLFELNSLADLSPDKGRFRSFLLASLNHFVADEWDRVRAQKRGAGQIVSWDAQSAETRYRLEPVDEATPEKLYERQWAMTLLREVAQRLQEEYAAAGKAGLFEELSFCLTGERSALPYQKLAERLNMSQEAVRVAVHRLRQRYRQTLRAEIAHLVASPAEIDQELRHLLRVLAD